ncbi:MAG TPA: TonB family protein [Anaeromyxobacteraceae bacterium]|nr:TonB family protein [Anaeromyxobacteraceae bacterium]
MDRPPHRRPVRPGLPLALVAAGALACAALPARASAQGTGVTKTVESPPPAAPEPTLAVEPRLEKLVPADVPPGTAFPSPEVVVVLTLDVGADGRVEKAEVASGAGEPFDSAALGAARKFEFAPGRLSTGEAVPVTVTFRLRIQEPAPPPPPAPVKLTGTLLERGSRLPIPGVPVEVLVGDRVVATARTDGSGVFQVEVPEAEFRLRALPPDHQPLDLLVRARPGEVREENYLLESAGGPNETVVSASAIQREVMKDVLTAEQVFTVPGSAGDTLKAVLNLPGAARPPFGAGLLVLRGSAPGDSKVFLESQQIPQLYHFGGIRSTFAPAFLQSVEFVPGNFSVDYGRAQGGIIDVRVRDPRQDGFHGQADVNVYDVGVEMEGGLGKGWSLGGAFRRSWIDTVLPLFLPKDANLSFSTAPRFYDFQFIAAWNPDASQRLRLIFYGSMDRLVALIDQPQRDPTITGALDARVSFYNLQGEYSNVFSPRLRQDTSLVLGLQEIVTQLGPQFFFDLNLRRLALRSTWSYDFSGEWQLRGGLDIQLDRARIAVNLPDSTGPNPLPPSSLPQVGAQLTTTYYSPAAFAELRWAPLPNLSVLPGLRANWFSDIRQWAVDPRLLARWEAVPGTTLKGAVGLYQQAPAPQKTNAATGNPLLLPERSLQASIGVGQRLWEGITLDVTGFYKALDQQAISNSSSVYDPAAPRYTSTGTGVIYGVETLLKVNVGDRFAGWLAYSYQRSLRTDPPAGQTPFDFDQPSNLTILGTYQLGRGWSAGARFRLVSGNPYTPVESSVFDSATGVYVPVYGETNSERLATYWALDLRVDKTWVFKDWTLTLYLDTQNVTNRKNQEGWTYNFDYAEKTPTTGLPILPILGLKGEW